MSVKFRFVCATRETQQQFATHTALGRSLALFPLPFIELRLFPSNSTGLSKLYNIAVREAASDPAILVFIHDDVQLLDLFWPIHMLQGLTAFDVIGIAGNKRRLPWQPTWCHKDLNWNYDEPETYLSGIVAHGSSLPPKNVMFYGPTFQQVLLLDGVMLICKSETLLSRNLYFDEAFDFHFYDLDFCRQAELQKLRLGTWSISVLHASEGIVGGPGWRIGYGKYFTKWKS